MQSYVYSIMAFVALAIHLIINGQLQFGHALGVAKGSRVYRLFLGSLLAYYLTDVAWGIIAGFGNQALLLVDTMFYFMALAGATIMWFRFVASYLEVKGWSVTGMTWFSRLILAYCLVGLSLNQFNELFFRFDEQGAYVAGPARHAAFGMLVLFSACTTLLSLKKALRSDAAVRRRNSAVFLFGLTMTVTIVLQSVWPLLPIFAFDCLLGSCFLHVFVVEDERAEFRRLEAEREAERRAEAARSYFFSAISHDIRTPLNAIVGLSELLEQGVDDPAERESFARTIRSSGQMLVRLVDDVLDLSRIARGTMSFVKKPTDVPAIVREVVESFDSVRSKKPVALEVEMGEMPRLQLDPQRLHQVLYKLLSNACKFTDSGKVVVRTAWDGSTLRLEVADTGRGIAPQDISRVLRPFEQAADHNHRDGTGLGLSISKRLVELQGGTLTIASVLGKGSTVTVALPVEAEGEKPSVHTAGAIACTKKILVVDDSKVNVAVICAQLRRLGKTNVVTATNGREALEVLESNRDVGLILTDYWMPELDGAGLVKAVRGNPEWAKLPVYLITADNEARKTYGEMGFNGIVLKPFTVESLRALPNVSYF